MSLNWERSLPGILLISLLTLSMLSILTPTGTASPQSSLVPSSVIPQASPTNSSPSPPCLTPSSSDLSTVQVPPSASNGIVANNTLPIIASQNATYNSDLPNSTTLNMELVFTIRNHNQFQQCLDAISDPKSPSYGKFLNATTLAPYLPTPGQRTSVMNYLQQRGFTVTPGPSPLVLILRAPAAHVKTTFSVKMGRYSKGSYKFYAANTDPSLPQNFASIVSSVGLDNFTRIVPKETPCGILSQPDCPQGIQVGYSLTNLYSSGFDGTGTTVAVVDELGDPNPCCGSSSALHVFDQAYGLNDPSFHYYCGGGITWNLDCSSFFPDSRWVSEAAMDIEAVHTVAPALLSNYSMRLARLQPIPLWTL